MVYLEFINKFTVSSLAVFVILLPLSLSLFSYHQLDRAFRLLVIFLCVDLVIGLWMFHLAAYRSNNILLLNVFVPIRYTLMGGMFIHYFHSNRIRRLITLSIIAFIPFTILDVYASNENLSDLHNHMVGRYSQVVESVLMILWGLLYFYEIINSLEVKNLTSYPFFWICAGLLFFYSGNIFFFPFWHFTNKWENDLKLGLIEKIPYVVEIISLLLFTVGIWNMRLQNARTES